MKKRIKDTKKSNIWKKVLAVALVLGILVPTLIVTTGQFFRSDTKAADLSPDDRKTAEEISNMTGVGIEDIVNLKTRGRTWNEVLDVLKKNQYNSPADKKDREKMLEQSGLGEDYTEDLKKEGFSSDEIMQAKMLVERAVFMLKEITDNSEDINAAPTIGLDKKDNKEDLTPYRELLEKIDEKMAIRLTLKLKKDFGTMEKAMDEYLFSLQADLNLEDYLKDKDAYEKQKKEKSLGLDMDKILTLEKIEQKMLEVIQKRNEKNRDDGKASQDKPSGLPGGIDDLKKDDNIPKPPIPDVGNVRPRDPRDEVMKEIEGIRDRSLNP